MLCYWFNSSFFFVDDKRLSDQLGFAALGFLMSRAGHNLFAILSLLED